MNGWTDTLVFKKKLLDNKKIFSEQNCFNIIFKVWNQKLYNIILNWYNKTYFIGQPPFELSMMFHCADCTGKVVPQAFFLLHYRYKICINTASFLHFFFIHSLLFRKINFWSTSWDLSPINLISWQIYLYKGPRKGCRSCEVRKKLCTSKCRSRFYC